MLRRTQSRARSESAGMRDLKFMDVRCELGEVFLRAPSSWIGDSRTCSLVSGGAFALRSVSAMKFYSALETGGRSLSAVASNRTSSDVMRALPETRRHSIYVSEELQTCTGRWGDGNNLFSDYEWHAKSITRRRRIMRNTPIRRCTCFDKHIVRQFQRQLEIIWRIERRVHQQLWATAVGYERFDSLQGFVTSGDVHRKPTDRLRMSWILRSRVAARCPTKDQKLPLDQLEISQIASDRVVHRVRHS